MSQAKEIRVRAKLSQTAAAALAEVSPHSWKLFEANAEALTPAVRGRCEAALARMTAGRQQAA